MAITFPIDGNLPPGPYLVVKTFSYSSQGDAVKIADKMAAETLRRPIDQLHCDVVSVQGIDDGRWPAQDWRYSVEVHYRVLT